MPTPIRAMATMGMPMTAAMTGGFIMGFWLAMPFCSAVAGVVCSVGGADDSSVGGASEAGGVKTVVTKVGAAVTREVNVVVKELEDEAGVSVGAEGSGEEAVVGR